MNPVKLELLTPMHKINLSIFPRRGERNRILYALRLTNIVTNNIETAVLFREELAALAMAITGELARNRSDAEERGFLNGRQ